MMMTNAANPPDTLSPVLAYARLLRQVHELIAQGKGDTDEAEALADRMDAPWYAMTQAEQVRMRGLSADLYALREGGPARVNMSPEQGREWTRALKVYMADATGNVDSFLSFLRQPIPSGLPRADVPFLQANCWEKLGDLETALLFMKEAARLDPGHAPTVLTLLQQLGSVNEVPKYANAVLDNLAAPPLERYLAAAALLSLTFSMSETEATPILQRAVLALRRSLSDYLALSPEERAASPEADAEIAQALAVGLDRLGDLDSAIAVYDEAIERQPQNGTLHVARGLALYEREKPRALADFAAAVNLGVDTIVPYLQLARHALQERTTGEALKLARAAERQPGPPAARAEVYELIGMALTELGHSQEEVLDYFDRALALDPKNDRIRENREIATTFTRRVLSGRKEQKQLVQAPPIEPERLRWLLSDQLLNRLERFNEKRRNRVSKTLVQV